MQYTCCSSGVRIGSYFLINTEICLTSYIIIRSSLFGYSRRMFVCVLTLILLSKFKYTLRSFCWGTTGAQLLFLASLKSLAPLWQ